MAIYDQLEVSQHFAWKKYEPDLTLSMTQSDCRFYITLFYNRLNGTFDRIIPIQGCNCQIPPPLSLLRNSQSKLNSTTLHTCSFKIQRYNRSFHNVLNRYDKYKNLYYLLKLNFIFKQRLYRKFKYTIIY